MKISHLNISGFRGFRDETRLELSASFNIICGRNGVGKSTVFDAIEFAITGSLDKYAGLGAAKDRPTDYIWWRGEGTPLQHYVSVGFTDNEGKTTDVVRTRESGAQLTAEETENILCEANRPADPLYQLCRTSIIRDELIAQLSVDLSENDRFDMVRNALGDVEASRHVSKARKAITVAEGKVKAAESEYDDLRQSLNRSLAELAIAQSDLSTGRDVDDALRLIRTHITNPNATIPEMIAEARKASTSIRNSADALATGFQAVEEIKALKADIASSAYQTKKAELSEEIERSSKNVADIERRLAEAQVSLQKEIEFDAMATALSALVSSGEHLGLHGDHCPLCNARRSPGEYAEGVAAAKMRLQEMKSGVTQAQSAVQELQESLKAEIAIGLRSRSAYDEWVSREEAISSREAENQAFFTRNDLSPTLIDNSAALEHEVSRQRNLWLYLTQALSAVESSGAADRVANIELRVTSLQRDVERAAQAIERAQKVLTDIKVLDRAAKRSGDEIIDEQLAVISPLLTEIYQRLRPHPKWRSIEYSIRGDVRRFLSLRVGQGLNPQFIFSSGQRRAAGIAFLLSVHLSRPWCKLNTILLDDPVQHIDDFRALHLVEVIATLRRTGRQVICAVEDSDLADLLSRRLSSELGGPGVRFDIEADGRIIVTAIPTLPRNVLKASEPRTAENSSN